MYSMELADYGLKLRTEGVQTVELSKAWGVDYTKILADVVARGKPFGQMVDLRGFKPMEPEAQVYVDKAMKEFKAAGGQRSAVILDSAVAAMQIRRLAIQSGMYEWERYISVESHPDWERVAKAWIVEGRDPDTK